MLPPPLRRAPHRRPSGLLRRSSAGATTPAIRSIACARCGPTRRVITRPTTARTTSGGMRTATAARRRRRP
eukprot:6826524-Prymnesium_polylepis.1